jgi:hypothetical protein
MGEPDLNARRTRTENVMMKEINPVHPARFIAGSATGSFNLQVI